MLLFLLFNIPRTTFTTIGGIPPPQEIIVISRVITREKFFFQKKFLRQKYVTFFKFSLLCPIFSMFLLTGQIIFNF